MCCRRLFILILLASLPAAAQPLRISLADAVQRALHDGSQAQLARSTEERARIARTEALQALFPQADARLVRYNQSINLQTFGFSIPGQPPIAGPFNVTDMQVDAAMQVFNLAAIRHYQALSQGESASRYAMQRAENDVATAVARLYVLTQRASTQIASRQSDIALFERLLKVAQDEFPAGTGTRLDVALATVQPDRAKQALLIAQNDQRTALLALLNAIGADEASEGVLHHPLPASPPGALRAVMALENENVRVVVAAGSARVAEAAPTVAEERWQAGDGTPVEVDRAQDSYRQAREDLIAAQADAAAAQYDLQHATGDIRK